MDTACFEYNPILFGNFLNNQTPASFNNITHVSEPLANDHVFNETVSSGICDLLDFEQNNTSTSLNVSLSATSDVSLNESNANNNAAARMNEKLARSSRKRQRNGEKWKIRANKKARQAGLEYILSTGLIMPRKLPVIDKDLCSCKKKCSEKISSDQRACIFNSYYNMDENSKNIYLYGSISSVPMKSKLVNVQRSRSATFAYYVTVNGDKTLICKEAFCALHSITQSKVRFICDKVRLGKVSPSSCKRSRHNNRPSRLQPEAIQQICEHITSFPADKSHYSRHSNANRKYLSATLTVPQMYTLYVNWCAEKAIEPASSRSYRDIFTTRFNLGFGNPRSDTCTCYL